jgi:hypothetical protein
MQRQESNRVSAKYRRALHYCQLRFFVSYFQAGQRARCGVNPKKIEEQAQNDDRYRETVRGSESRWPGNSLSASNVFVS